MSGGIVFVNSLQGIFTRIQFVLLCLRLVPVNLGPIIMLHHHSCLAMFSLLIKMFPLAIFIALSRFCTILGVIEMQPQLGC